MQPIFLHWFATQQQTSTSKQRKFDLFYPKFSPDLNEVSQAFQNRQEVAKKWLKLKLSRKPHICGIRRLRVKTIDNKIEQNKPQYNLDRQSAKILA